jgi:hypothetical protein
MKVERLCGLGGAVIILTRGEIRNLCCSVYPEVHFLISIKKYFNYVLAPRILLIGESARNFQFGKA